MSVSTKHPKYEKVKFTWKSIRDAIEGTNAVKRAHEVYLPMPTGMLLESTSPAIARNQVASADENTYLPQNLPWFHSNPAYMAYLQRARFPEIASHTLRGLTGVAIRREPDFELDGSVAHLEEKATRDGLSLIDLYAKCISEVLATGRLLLTLDVDTSTNLPYISLYNSESLINWNSVKDDDGNEQVTLVVLEEADTKLDSDGFTHVNITRHRALKIELQTDEDGNLVEGQETIVTVKTYVDDKETDTLTPSLQGKTLTELPVVCIGATDNNFEPDIIPMLGISEIAFSIYRKDADLSNGEFLTCNPTLFMTGVVPDVSKMMAGGEAPDPDGAASKVLLGSNVILKISNPAAKVAYTQTDTAGFQHVSARIQALFTEAAEYGASMLGPQKRGVESTESLKLRQADNGATLVGIADQVSKGIQTILHMCENWNAGKKLSEPANSVFEGVTDFAELKLTSQDVQALVTAWMARGISHETLLFNIKEAGLMEEGKTIEEEMGLIELEGPVEPTGEGSGAE